MSRLPPAPAGFVRIPGPHHAVYADQRWEGAIRSTGLDAAEAWAAAIRSGAGGDTGRGRLGRVELPEGPEVLIKQMRRGGLLAPLWRDRFTGPARLLDNLRSPREAERRGIRTAPAVALMLRPGPPGLYRGWLAVERVRGARDLASRLGTAPGPGAGEIEAAIGLVRSMHDAGLEHRDLNLGNLLLRSGKDGKIETFVVDLDGARWHGGPLPFRLRQRGLRRLERSWFKTLGGEARGREPGTLYALYAAGEADLAAKLERGRGLNRLLIRLHRLRWR